MVSGYPLSPDQLSKFLSVCAHSQALALRLPILALLVFALLATRDPFSQSFELLKVPPWTEHVLEVVFPSLRSIL